MNVIIGTRGSKLALAQAEYVKNRLQKHYPQNSYELKIISTKGDREQKKALDQIGDKGLFVREIEQELLDGTISLAVHSMKDMPAEQPSGLVFAHAWKREDPRDVLILREAVSLEELPQHAVIGTGSRRRAFQLLQLRKDLRITGIRGNVDTRIKKMQEEQLDGIVLAAAGLHRLGRTSLITQYLFRSYGAYRNPAAQGTLALELREDHKELFEQVNALSDIVTEEITCAERLFLKGTGGDCHMPIGAYACKLPDGRMQLLGMVGSADGSSIKNCKVFGETPQEAAQRALRETGCTR